MKKRLFAFLGSLLAVAAFAIGLIVTENGELPVAVATSDELRATSLSTASVTSTNATVVRTVDGDTLVATLDAEPGEFTVRLLGIDTPETVDPRKPVQCFGKEASNKLRSLIEGERVRLDADPEADERDRYDRLLRNVVAEDGTDVNALLVKDGYAHAYLSFPLNRERKRKLHDLEEEAKIAQRGLWSPKLCP